MIWNLLLLIIHKLHKNNNIKNKMNEKFGSLIKKEDNEDDLLDLMDKNI